MTNRDGRHLPEYNPMLQSESTAVNTLLWAILYFGFIGFGVFVISSILLDSSKASSITDIAEVIVVAATGLVIIWYTVETQRLRIESQKQTELQLRPFVVVETGEFGEATPQDIHNMFPPQSTPPRPRILTPPHEYNFRVRNVGNGTAINVKVKDGPIKEKPEFVLQEPFNFYPSVIPILLPGEARFVFHSPNKLKPNREYFARKIKVEFMDVNMGNHMTHMEIDGGELIIINQTKNNLC